MEEQHLRLRLDSRLGSYVVAKDGSFCGFICNIYDNQFGQTWFTIRGKTLPDNTPCVLNDVDPLSVFFGKE